MTPESLTETYKSLSDGLYRVAYYILESQSDAQDAVQDLFIKLWNTREQLDTVLNLKAYCTTLMKNLCIDRLRRESKVQSTELTFDMAETRQIEDDYMTKEKLRRVMTAIGKLPARQRDVMRMYVFEEKSYDEIAKITGMSNLTLRVLLSNARKSLRNEI
ncbi:MAG: sigma-70 family RNA polymerase sigma factor [Bacteroidaceae bacterium]|nr:sigma-70 family RNA polymerase sigma factor [Candidatus Colenecus caballi]MCQ2072909.1 sigma-70 family RNA polymerase sigma factor [Bacteroidaceae bacterium]